VILCLYCLAVSWSYRRAVGPCPTTYRRCWASFWVHSRWWAAYHTARCRLGR